MNNETTVTCPNCGVILPAGGLGPGVAVQCARCSTQFTIGATVATMEQTTSGKAIASMVLGLCSIVGFCFTGIPAIILGILAFGDIRRRPRELRGHGLAVAGIITGSVCGLVCAPLVGGTIWFATRMAQEFSFTDEPAEVSVIAAKIGEYEVPPDIKPIGGMDAGIFGAQVVVFGDEKENPNTMIMVMKFPALFARNRQQMEMQMQQQWRMQTRRNLNIEEVKQQTYTIGGKPVQVTESIGKDLQSGAPHRQYVGLLDGLANSDSGPVMVMIFTSDSAEEETKKPEAEEQPEAKRVTLTEEQVREFFESFR